MYRPVWEQAYIDWIGQRVYWTGKGFRLHDDRRRSPRWAAYALSTMGREDRGPDDDHDEYRPFSIEVFHRHAMLWVNLQRGWTVHPHGRVRCACGIDVSARRSGPQHHEGRCVFAEPGEAA